MSVIVKLAIRWFDNSHKGKGIRLSAEEVALLKDIGIVEMMRAAIAADENSFVLPSARAAIAEAEPMEDAAQ